MFESIAGRYDLLNTVLSCGLHRLWEARLVSELPAEPAGRCLDLCTGTGALIPRLMRRYREVVGVDISPKMLEVARKRFSRFGNVKLCEDDAQRLSFKDAEFDVVTVAYGVRNWPDTRAGLSQMYRVLRPGGSVGILEFGQPKNGLWSRFFGLYSRYIIPAVGGAVSGNRAPYEYLPKTSAVFPCGETFINLLRGAGFSEIRVVELAGGVAYIYVARRS